MDISLLRQLAKSQQYQDLYILCKELHLKFFKNDYDLSYLQIIFLKYVSFYYSIIMDISLGEVGERVLENEIYEDSYSLYKNKKDKKSYKQSVNSNEDKNIGRTNKWLFKSPRK